ncbi:helix-turn-helix domain-containing protein [Kineosporia mesophila]|nr:helix-turn-helix transcriptional regulator [Kineosporia mesophila]MCD5354547.1 helix-turn-helix transcriptional regulator [Kineosporia mesophila]
MSPTLAAAPEDNQHPAGVSLLGMENLLGEFIKARRGQVSPQEPGTKHRRVTGLRRAELASLAGISEPYLVRLEQGIDRQPSPQVLQALARALRLDDDATRHLLGLTAPEPVRRVTPDLADNVHQLLDSWPTTPAYVRDRHFGILAANKLAQSLSDLYTPGRNLVREIFLGPRARTLFPDWPLVAAQTVAAVRAETEARDPEMIDLIAELSQDKDFRQLWARHHVRPARDETKRFEHPVVGPLTLRRQAMAIAGADGFVVIVYQAEPQSASAAALSRL